jgi:5-bromo-4-chloroindolyl phosphate hydrolysis protein
MNHYNKLTTTEQKAIQKALNDAERNMVRIDKKLDQQRTELNVYIKQIEEILKRLELL